MRLIRITYIWAALGITGCAAEQADFEAEAAVAAVAAPLQAAQPRAGLSFRQEYTRTAFNVGDSARSEANGQYERIVGAKGVFMVDRHSGATKAVRHATAASQYPRAWSENSDEHTVVAKNYLIESGAPEDEISGTHVTTTMAGSAPIYGASLSASRLLWHTTHLERSLSGIRVEGSFSYAALDSGGGVIEEGVYWPEIPAATVQQAVALKNTLDDPSARASFLNSVRAAHPEVGDQVGEVRIVHTSAGYAQTFQSKAAYTVNVKSSAGRYRVLRIGGDGRKTSLPDEGF